MADFWIIILESFQISMAIILLLFQVMFFMTVLMNFLEYYGGFVFIESHLWRGFKRYGIDSSNILVIPQILLVSFAAPAATLSKLAKNYKDAKSNTNNIQKHQIAATLAMILTMSQANATLPLWWGSGLNLLVVFATSIFGGICAAAVTYKILSPHMEYKFGKDPEHSKPKYSAPRKQPYLPKWIKVIINKWETLIRKRFSYKIFNLYKLIVNAIPFQLTIKAVPYILVSVILVNILKAYDIILILENSFAPALNLIGVSSVFASPIITKYLAGGTSMMSVTLNLFEQGNINALELNRIAGVLINPIDPVGLGVLIPYVRGIKYVLLPAVLGALIGIAVRGLLHIVIF